MVLNNLIEFVNNKEVTDRGIREAKSLFGENQPYIVERRLTGKKYIFNEHFINTVITALTNDCLDGFNDEERELFMKFVSYENNISIIDITSNDTEVSKQLDQWLLNLMLCRSNPVVNGCIDSYIEHKACN